MRIVEFLQQWASDQQGFAGRSLGHKALVLSGSLVVMGLATAAALNAMVVLLLAIGVMYYLATQVLGMKIELDARNLVQQAQRYASASAPN